MQFSDCHITNKFLRLFAFYTFFISKDSSIYISKNNKKQKLLLHCYISSNDLKWFYFCEKQSRLSPSSYLKIGFRRGASRAKMFRDRFSESVLSSFRHEAKIDNDDDEDDAIMQTMIRLFSRCAARI